MNFRFLQTIFGLCLIIGASLTTKAQVSEVVIELSQELDGVIGDTDFTGYNVYHIYAVMEPGDQLMTVYSFMNEEPNLIINTDCGSFEHPMGGITAEEIDCDLIPFQPDLEYDSFYTIGKLCDGSEGNITALSVIPSVFPDVVGDQLIEDGAIFQVPDGSVNGVAGADGKVLIAQVTTCDMISIDCCTQILIQGENGNDLLQCWSASYLDGEVEQILGCTDAGACNYNATANTNDGSCAYLSTYELDGTFTVEVNSVETYDVGDVGGAGLFDWEVTGGTIQSGQGSTMIEVLWGSEEGVGTVKSTEDLDGVCEAETTTIEIEILNSSSINELQDLTFELYPNPATSSINIDFGSVAVLPAIVKIFDNQGKVVQQFNPTQSFTIVDVSDLPASIYQVVSSWSEGQMHAHTLIIE